MLVTLCMPIIDLLVAKAFYINWLSNQFTMNITDVCLLLKSTIPT